MNKIVILYASVHHRNTEKVIKHIASVIQTDAIDILKTKNPDISQYEIIILASGIYFNTFHKSILEYIKKTPFTGKKTILLYTCGLPYRNYAKSTAKILIQKGAKHLGSLHCRGFDTYGPLEKIGGIAKNHPNQKDVDRMLNDIRKFIGNDIMENKI